MVPLPPNGRALLDLAQIGCIAAAGVAALRGGRPAGLRWAAALTVLDLAVATARYTGEAAPIHLPRHVESVSALDFLGAERFPEALQDWAFLEPALTKRPTMAVWGGLLPELVALDAAAGTPSVFRSFAAFPPRWWETGTERVISVVPSELRAVPVSGASPAGTNPAGVLGPPSTPTCPTAAADAPTATVTELLSTRVRVDVRTACDRLLVYLDTWAPGWRARIDGRPVPTLRVNGAVRGVLVPAGSHTLEWTYRPDHLPVLLTIMAASAMAAIALARLPPGARRSSIADE